MSRLTIQKYTQNIRGLFSRYSSSLGSNAARNEQESSEGKSNNTLIQPVFHNRNPRNLELLTIAEKPEGYHLDRYEVKFWYKLNVHSTPRNITAEVVHYSGSTIMSVSTSEFGIRRFLYRPTDKAAFKTVGKVLARRCIESGINSVFCDVEAKENTKMAYLLEEAQKGGLCLSEADVYTKPFHFSKITPVKPWDIVS